MSMGRSVLAKEDRLSLGNGLTLRLLSGMELLEARREAHSLAEHPLEQPLCSNACLLARALGIEGEAGPLFHSGREVLLGLTAEEIEGLCAQWDAFRRDSGPVSEADTETGVNVNFQECRRTEAVFDGEEPEQ